MKRIRGFRKGCLGQYQGRCQDQKGQFLQQLFIGSFLLSAQFVFFTMLISAYAFSAYDSPIGELQVVLITAWKPQQNHNSLFIVQS